MILVSIFTPTHKPQWLAEAFASLVKQTYNNWEWVLLPNGNGPVEIPAAIRGDPRVRVLPHSKLEGIGALKAMCCKNCKGQLFVELDHDDSLTPDCLATLVYDLEKTGAGFLFSDAITYYPNHKSETYMKEFGWEDYPYEYDGKKYQIAKSFDVTARSLCEIFFAPNHVRAWTRQAYTKAGGHDQKIKIADDHDLICRTYLAGVPFHFIDRPLYLYRRHNANHCEVQADDVYKAQLDNMNRYTHPLIFEWCRRNGLAMWDLGGAHNCPKDLGFQSLDCEEVEGVDLVADVVTGFNFHEHIEPNSVGCFRAADFLEHIPPGGIVKVMNRLYDALAPGGWIISSTPAVSDNDGRVGRGAFQDPTHVSFWSENNFWYFTDKEKAKYIPKLTARFQAVRIWTEYPSEWHFHHQIPYVMADLVALKGQREAGESLV